MSVFHGLLNRTIAVSGASSSSVDGGGQPIYTSVAKGTVKGRIDPKVRPDELNGPDLNPIISEYIAITALPATFDIVEADTLTSDGQAYEVVGVAELHGRAVPHHLEIDLRRVA